MIVYLRFVGHVVVALRVMVRLFVVFALLVLFVVFALFALLGLSVVCALFELSVVFGWVCFGSFVVVCLICLY